MGLLWSRHAAEQVVLYPEHTLGRSKSCLLRVTHPGVSALHAVVFWADEAWYLKDLGSRNGTYLNGRRLPSGERELLVTGGSFELGASGPAFELRDDGAPKPLLVADGDPTFLRPVDDGMLVIPSEDQPEALVFVTQSGDWCVESEAGVQRIEEDGVFSVGGRSYRLIASRGVPATLASQMDRRATLSGASLKFAVSTDEEHVELTVVVPEWSVALGHRAHHYLLLTLARERLKHRAEGLPEGAQGWVERLDLERMLLQTQQHINLAVWRARRQFADAGFVDSMAIVERRGSALRLGVSQLSVERE